MKFGHMQSYCGSARAEAGFDCVDSPVILVQRENTPCEELSILQSLGFEVFFGGNGIQSDIVPVFVISEADLSNEEVRERLVALAHHWPEAYMFCVNQSNPYPNPANWVDAGDTTERLVESGLGHFFNLDLDNAACRL